MKSNRIKAKLIELLKWFEMQWEKSAEIQKRYEDARNERHLKDWHMLRGAL